MLVAAPTGSGKTVVGEFADPPGDGHRPQGVLHDADQGAVQPEVPRPGRPLRPRAGRPADRRQRHQRRGADRRDDDRGAAQHAVRRLAHPHRARVRGDGRGALPRRPRPRRGLGGGHHPPARVGHAGVAVGDGLQRRGVRRVAGHRARRDDDDRRGAAAGAALPARHGRTPPARPVRLLRRRRGRRLRQGGRPGQRRAAQGRPRRLGGLAASRTGARRKGRAAPGPAAGQQPPGLDPQPSRRHRPARSASGCCRRSCSSSAGSAATPPSSSAWPPGST